MAKDSKSKQTHVGFGMSILVESQGACMQIKNNLLHIFPIEIWLEEGNKCIIVVHSELPLSALASSILKFKHRCFATLSRDKAATTISANKIVCLTLTQLYFKP